MIVAAWIMLGGVVWLIVDGWVTRQANPNADLAQVAEADSVVLEVSPAHAGIDLPSIASGPSRSRLTRARQVIRPRRAEDAGD